MKRMKKAKRMIIIMDEIKKGLNISGNNKSSGNNSSGNSNNNKNGSRPNIVNTMSSILEESEVVMSNENNNAIKEKDNHDDDSDNDDDNKKVDNIKHPSRDDRDELRLLIKNTIDDMKDGINNNNKDEFINKMMSIVKEKIAITLVLKIWKIYQ